MFSVFACNRTTKTRGGGVLILIKNPIKAVEIYKESQSGYEMIIIDIIKKGFTNVRLICIYFPPNLKNTSNVKLIKTLTKYYTHNTIICGDLNKPKIIWKEYISSIANDTIFLDFLMNFGYKQLITAPTHISGSILDLIITNKDNLISEIHIDKGFSNSDHFSIRFNIKVSKDQNTIHQYRNFTIENINRIKPILIYYLGFNEISPNIDNTMNEKFNNFYNLVQSITEQYFPYISVKEKSGFIYPSYIKKSIKDKQNLFNLLKQKQCSKSEYNRICNRTKYLIKNYLNSKISVISNNRKFINNFIKKSLKPKQNIPVLLHNNKYIFDDAEKTELFGIHFSEIFNNICGSNYDEPPLLINNDNTLDDIDFDILSVANTLKALPNKNSSTHEDISYKILRNCYDIFAPTLCELFRISLDSGDIPEEWKHSTIIPIFKNGNKSHIQNYRPISLTSTTCRVFEKILSSEILKFFMKNNLFSQHQFGFIPKRSTTTQMISILNKWYEGLLNNQNTDIIYFDFQKAFDKVPINYLLNKLQFYGIRGKIHRWIKNFLYNRTFTVRINDETSKIFYTHSGVPQGTILGPLLFTIYINDLPAKLGNQITPALYADDLKITYSYKVNNKLLQDEINLVNDWAHKWGLAIANNKSYVLYVGNKNPKTPYFIQDHKIEQVELVKDLGIYVDNKLTFKKHINIICRNAFLRVHQLLRTIHTYNPKIWGNIFKTYVLPILEYASPIWNPKQKDLVKKLEKVQKFYTRSALNKCRKTKLKYKDRLILFQLEPLLFRRYYLDLVTIYKIYFNLTSLNPTELFTLNSRPSRRHDYIIQVSRKNSKTTNSFLNRTIQIWNLLPKEIFINHTINTFKIHLRLCLPHILEKLQISI